MKIVRLFILLVVAVVFGSACKDNSVSYEKDLAFSGITETDTEGNLIVADLDDWKAIALKDSLAKIFPPFPNPTFNIPMKLLFSLPHSSGYKFLTSVSIINTKQDTIKFLVNQILSSGQYQVTWDLTDKAGVKLQPGIYRCFIQVESSITYGDVEVKNYTQIADSSYVDFANQHWDERRYWRWLSSETEIDIDDMASLRAAQNDMTFLLPLKPDELYYELIGKVNHYVKGWKDETNGSSQFRGEYLRLWKLAHSSK